MWDVFAAHLRRSWNRPVAAAAAATGGSGEDGGGDLLAMDVDAELFVLFLRNLHVTSSIASCVGKLCTGLAQEVRVIGFQGYGGG